MVIAGCGEPEKNLQAMDSVKRHMDTGMGLLINTPGMPASPDDSGHKANGLPAGYSENGGIFCQTNCWAIIAEALLGRGDTAWKYYKQVIPHEVIRRIGLDNYKGEAYAYSSTILGPDNEQFGQACVSQVTGTAAWMDVAVTQYLLGIRPTIKGLFIDPCIPSDWDGFSVERTYRGCKLNIRVENPNHVQKGVASVTFNGINLRTAFITDEYLYSSSSAEVSVVMG